MENIKLVVGAVVTLLVFFLVLTLVFFPGFWVDEDKIVTAVQNQGFSDVVVDDKDILFISWNGCGRDDDAAFEITATNSLGNRVPLVACAGWPLKGVTIRSD